MPHITQFKLRTTISRHLLSALVATGLIMGSTVPSFADSTNNNVVQFGYMNTPTAAETNNSTVNQIRSQALEDAATSLGARGALAWRATHIDGNLKNQASQLDSIFNFSSLIIKPNVLPPVLTQSNQDYTQDDNNTIRLAAKTYNILRPARFITTPPTWRDYLWLNFKKPSMPDKSLLPQNKAEVQVWNQYFKQGWQQGLTQANQIFAANVNRLKRDINGMILYRQLLKQHIVSAPYISHADLGVTGDSNHIRINDQVLRITAKAKLQTNSKAWQPVITQ